jgi:uncharacterized SAM-binding protein YcdF (DUF218 family)
VLLALSPPASHRQRRPRDVSELRRLRLTLLALLVALAAATLALFVFPDDDEPGRADAVVVLAGGRQHRLDEGLRLVRQGVAPVLAISAGRDEGWTEANRLCGQRRPFEVVCFDAKPFSTRGEAEWTARTAESRGWDSVVVVTSTYHVFRSRILFDRCLNVDLAVVGADPPADNFLIGLALEWPKLGHALTVGRKC